MLDEPPKHPIFLEGRLIVERERTDLLLASIPDGDDGMGVLDRLFGS